MKDKSNNRLYSEKEIGALIQRATKLQEHSGNTSTSGLTLEEIEHIAQELGLSPRLIKKAAIEMELNTDAGQQFSLTGSPFVIEESFIVDGVISEAEWNRMVLKMLQITGSSGKVSNVGESREWSHDTEDGGLIIEKTQVVLSPEDDHSAIQIRQYYKAAAYSAYLLGFFVSATATGIALDGGGLPDLVNLGIVTGGGLSGLAAVRAGLALWTQKQKKRLHTLADSLNNLVSPELDSEINTGPSAENIDIPDIETDKNSTPNSRKQRSRS